MKLCGHGTRKKAKKKTLRQKLLLINKVVRRRTNETYKEIRQITGEMADLAKEVVKKVRKFAEKLMAIAFKSTNSITFFKR